MMKKIWIIKVFYYLFFVLIFLVALIIFLEIMDYGFYDQYLREFIYKIINNLRF